MSSTQPSAIVTGAGSGMGAATARLLAQNAYKVAVLDINQEAAQIVADEIGGVALACDVADSKGVEDALLAARKAHGIARVCVNCAGIAPAMRIVGKEGPQDLAAFSKVINTNLLGTFNVMRVAAAAMYNLDLQDEERGVIINTASVAAFEGQIGQAAYSASKGGVVSMTLPAAREFAKFAIRVNCIAPGLIETPLLKAMPEAVQDELVGSIPFPKRFGKVDEFAKLVLHIIQNKMINAEVIRLDGALRMA